MTELRKGLDFDDVLLIPISSSVNSREEVDLSTTLGNLELKIPIIAAPMKGIVGIDLIIELGKIGGLGILSRFYNEEKERQEEENTAEEDEAEKDETTEQGTEDVEYGLEGEAGERVLGHSAR